MAPRKQKTAFEGRVESYKNLQLRGWLWSPARPDATLDVEVRVGDGRFVAAADRKRPQLVRGRKGGGHHGFELALPVTLDAGNVHEIRVFAADSDFELEGSPVVLDLRTSQPEGVFVGISPDGIATGWAVLPEHTEVPATVEIWVDGECAGKVLANGFHSDLVRLNDRRGYCTFECQLPTHALDGLEHTVDVRFAGTDTHLDASPQSFRATPGTSSNSPTDVQEPDLPTTPAPPPPRAFRRSSSQSTSGPPPVYLRCLQAATLDCDDGAALRRATQADAQFLDDLLDGQWPASQDLPLISIIMPTRDRACILAEAIQSVLEQSYPHWELWICDGGSTDNSREVVDELADPRVHHLVLAETNEATVANYGLRFARGELLAYLLPEDLWHPDHLAAIATGFERCPQARAAYTGHVTMHLVGARVAHANSQPPPVDYLELLRRPSVRLSSFAHRRDLLEQHGLFDAQMDPLHARDLQLRYLTFDTPLPIPAHTSLHRTSRAWEPAGGAAEIPSELVEKVERRAIARLGSAQDGQDRTSVTSASTATVRVVITDQDLGSALEAMSLAETFSRLTETHLQVVEASAGADVLTSLPTTHGRISPFSLEDCSPHDVLLPTGRGTMPSARARWIVDRAWLDAPHHEGSRVLRSPWVPRLLWGMQHAGVEQPFNLPTGMRNHSPQVRARFAGLRGDQELLTVVRVSAQHLAEARGDGLHDASCGRLLFVDCESLRARDPVAEDTFEVTVQELHALQQEADVWVDWALRDSANFVDVWLAQAALEGCVVASASISKADPLVASGAILRVPSRAWSHLAKALRALDKGAPGGEEQRLRTRTFALTHFSDAAATVRAARLLVDLDRPTQGAHPRAQPALAAPPPVHQPREHADVPALRELLLRRPQPATEGRPAASGGPNEDRSTRTPRLHKLVRDPRRFFADSQNPWVKAVGALLYR